jgi:tetratricopeptide (TPR) repeat protein
MRLPEIAGARAAREHPINPDPDDLAMRCEAGFENSFPGTGAREAAFGFCERALQLDGRNVRALSIAANKYVAQVTNLWSTDRQGDIRQAEDLVSRALAIDPNYYLAHQVKALILYAQKRGDEAVVEAERSLVLNPSYIPAYGTLCVSLFSVGRVQEQIACANKAIRLSPRDPVLFIFFYHRGLAHFALHEDGQAIEWLRRSVALNMQFSNAQATLAAALALSGHETESRDILERYLLLSTTKARTISQWKIARISDHPVWLAYRERLYEGLRIAGMPDE